ncbi:MAG TPA: GTP cyclohydrolase [Pseudohongiella sp.]|nr:GTP cyclohydrolase [Pseudohongiella sp.]HBX38022.1 GTP cyclohydrolase [Pseudohongiella sp.]|tara:strand:- start:59778 stop:60512 length:735 start_codon:yes stop_codon:yes gene_type:complete
MNFNQRLEQWLVDAQQAFHQSTGRIEQRPHVTLCYAQSWDGSITTGPGETLALSSPEGLRMTHQLRSLHDGILVGIGTVLADNPRLNVREWTGNDPQPIVLDSQLRLPPSSKLCQNGSNGKRPCWVLTTQQAEAKREGCDLIVTPGDGEGHVDLTQAMQALYQRGIRTLMVEGGAAVITAFLRTRLADAVVLTVAPVLVGGYNAIGRLADPAKVNFPHITPLQSEQLGDEMIVWGRLKYRAEAA